MSDATRVRGYQKGKTNLDLTEAREWVAVATASGSVTLAPGALQIGLLLLLLSSLLLLLLLYGSLHLALDRYAGLHPTTQFFTGQMPESVQCGRAIHSDVVPLSPMWFEVRLP